MQPQTQRVLIRVSDTTLSFATQTGEGEIIYEPFPVRNGIAMAANLREAFRNSDILLGDYRRAFVCIDSPTLVLPIDEADTDVEGKYHYVYPDSEGSSVEVHIMPMLNVAVAYAVNKDLKTVLEDNFTDVRLLPLMATTWEFLMRRNMTSGGKKLFAYFHDGKMEVCAFSRNRFLFVNTFEGTDAHDAVYYALGVWKQLGLNGNEDELHFMGNVPEQEWFVEEMRQFVRKVFPITPAVENSNATATQTGGMAADMIITFNNL